MSFVRFSRRPIQEVVTGASGLAPSAFALTWKTWHRTPEHNAAVYPRDARGSAHLHEREIALQARGDLIGRTQNL